MANIFELLPLEQKSSNANESEYFVFLPNNLTDIDSVSSINSDTKFCHAIAEKNKGNARFENNQYEDAILHYNRGIDILEGMDSPSCAAALSVCYQNRASANAFQENYQDAIRDASKAIELNKHYGKAYYRRAMCFFALKRYYLALQDIMQACVLKRFKNRQYINLAIEIIAEIDKLPTDIMQLRKAYQEMVTISSICDLCRNYHLKFLKSCGVFEALNVKFSKKQKKRRTGYIRAVAGINNLNISEIMEGCNEEIAKHRKYWAQSYILQAYVSTAVIQAPTTLNRDLQRDVQRMNHILLHPTIDVLLKHQATFCRANILNSIGQSDQANRDLRSLEGLYGSTSLFHVIKSGVLNQLPLRAKRFLAPLEECTRYLPNVYEIQFQVVQARSIHMSDRIASLTLMIRSMEDLVERFPLEIGPRVVLAGLYVDLDGKKATRVLQQAEKDFPNRLGEMIALRGLLQPDDPVCVDYFKRGIEAHQDNPSAFEGLLDYYETTTHEYAKVLEVSTKAMFLFLKLHDFKTMFERRHQLLKRIIHFNFWDKL